MTDDILKFLAGPPLGSIPVVKNPHVPLTRKERDERGVEIVGGAEESVLFWQIGGEIHVHPDRWDEFERHIALVNEAMVARKENR